MVVWMNDTLKALFVIVLFIFCVMFILVLDNVDVRRTVEVECYNGELRTTTGKVLVDSNGISFSCS